MNSVEWDWFQCELRSTTATFCRLFMGWVCELATRENHSSHNSCRSNFSMKKTGASKRRAVFWAPLILLFQFQFLGLFGTVLYLRRSALWVAKPEYFFLALKTTIKMTTLILILTKNTWKFSLLKLESALSQNILSLGPQSRCHRPEDKLAGGGPLPHYTAPWFSSCKSTSYSWSYPTHYLLFFICLYHVNGSSWKVESEIARSCLTLFDLPGSSVHGILQARILEWFWLCSPLGVL